MCCASGATVPKSGEKNQFRNNMSDTNIIGKTVLIDRQPAVLYSALSDLNALVANLPEDKRRIVSATQDTISANLQGFNFGMRVIEREPFSRVTFSQTDGSPIDFTVDACFDTVDIPDNPDADCKTNFHLDDAWWPVAGTFGSAYRYYCPGSQRPAGESFARKLLLSRGFSPAIFH